MSTFYEAYVAEIKASKALKLRVKNWSLCFLYSLILYTYAKTFVQW